VHSSRLLSKNTEQKPQKAQMFLQLFAVLPFIGVARLELAASCSQIMEF